MWSDQPRLEVRFKGPGRCRAIPPVWPPCTDSLTGREGATRKHSRKALGFFLRGCHSYVWIKCLNGKTKQSTTHRTVTNPLNHKIQRKRNTPWPAGGKDTADRQHTSGTAGAFQRRPGPTPSSAPSSPARARLEPEGRAPGPFSPPRSPAPWVLARQVASLRLHRTSLGHGCELCGSTAWSTGAGGFHSAHLRKCRSAYCDGFGINHGTRAGRSPSQLGTL